MKILSLPLLRRSRNDRETAMSDPLQVIVVGGGAAGFFGAIACARTNPQAQVTLLEASSKFLTKVRISGGGRCNVTHACFDPAQLAQNYPRGSKALRGPFARFQPQDTVEWFRQAGIELKTEADGRMFPTTDNSETIARCLLDTAEAAGVTLRTRTKVTAMVRRTGAVGTIAPKGEQFAVTTKSGETLLADRVLLATGSSRQGYELAKSLGHQIQPPVPSLFTFNIDDPDLHALAGITIDPVQVQLPQGKLKQTGPLLVVHWGLSGPAVLKLSAWGARFLHDCNYKTPLRVNWLPKENPEHIKETMQQLRSQSPRKAIASWCPFGLPKRLWQYLLASLNIDLSKRWSQISNKEIQRLQQALIQSQYQITGKGVFKEEFVTCGGVSLKEVDFKTMESRCCQHLYFAGEILDIDAVTGGFNFQSAWTTAWLAGCAMAQTTRSQT